MPQSRIEKTLFSAILASFLIAGALYAIYTPRWQAPDEPAHYNYIKQVAESGCCPRISQGDWRSDYLSLLTTSKFANEHLGGLDSIQYEDHHPPLYYLLASAVYKLSDGDLISLRLFSVALGAGVVALSFAISRRILPAHPQIALGTMALVAFLPQHLSMLSAVNNDALAELIVALALLWLLRYFQTEELPIWQLGLVVGLALVIKITIYFLSLIVPLAIWLRWRNAGQSLKELTRSLAQFMIVAGIIGGLWWLRNIGAYSFPDFLGLGAHDAVVTDQLRTADYIAEHGAQAYISQLLSVTYKSFWGQFGWMALPLDGVLGGWIYRGFALLLLAGLSGALLRRRSQLSNAEHSESSDTVSAQVWSILLATVLLVLLQFIYYNIEFVQWQGRYLFPALIPIAFALLYGLDYWQARLFASRQKARWLTALLPFGLLALDIYLLFRVIVPGLSP